MTREEVINAFLSLRYQMGCLPTFLEFIQKTDVTLEDLMRCFPTTNYVDSYFRMLKECSAMW